MPRAHLINLVREELYVILLISRTCGLIKGVFAKNLSKEVCKRLPIIHSLPRVHVKGCLS